MCATAWQFLQERLNHPAMKRQEAVLNPKLVIRESSCRGAKPEPAVAVA
jgi:DNA-binding LacI/PurR family transcriptional regulator